MALLPTADPLDDEALLALLGGQLPSTRAQQSRGPVMRNPVPEIMKETPSVMEPGWKTAARSVGKFLGVDDPNSQVLGAVGTVGEQAEGPIAKALDKLLQKGSKLAGRAYGDLAGTLKSTRVPSEYDLRGPTVSRLRDFYKIGTAQPSTSNWQGGQADALLQAFGGDKEKARQWLRLWGATSPNSNVPKNTQESVSALLYALENPNTPMTVEAARNLPQGKITTAPSKVPNINRAMAGQPLSGDKVEAMAGYMLGEPRIPIDVHTLYMAGSEHNKFDKELKALRAVMRANENAKRGAITNTDIYLRYENALKNAISEFDPQRDLNAIFGDMWEGGRAHKGLKPQGGPLDILRKKGLLEMGAMLDPERLRAALAQKGWKAGAIAGLMAGLGSAGAAVPDDGASKE